jgi:hypothetical protein
MISAFYFMTIFFIYLACLIKILIFWAQKEDKQNPKKQYITQKTVSYKTQSDLVKQSLHFCINDFNLGTMFE